VEEEQELLDLNQLPWTQHLVLIQYLDLSHPPVEVVVVVGLELVSLVVLVVEEEIEVRLVEELVIVLHKLLHKVMMVETLVVPPTPIEAVAAAVLVLLVGMVHHLEQEQVVLVFKF